LHVGLNLLSPPPKTKKKSDTQSRKGGTPLRPLSPVKPPCYWGLLGLQEGVSTRLLACASLGSWPICNTENIQFVRILYLVNAYTNT
jgi:hypothetical protein